MCRMYDLYNVRTFICGTQTLIHPVVYTYAFIGQNAGKIQIQWNIACSPCKHTAEWLLQQYDDDDAEDDENK